MSYLEQERYEEQYMELQEEPGAFIDNYDAWIKTEAGHLAFRVFWTACLLPQGVGEKFYKPEDLDNERCLAFYHHIIDDGKHWEAYRSWIADGMPSYRQAKADYLADQAQDR